MVVQAGVLAPGPADQPAVEAMVAVELDVHPLVGAVPDMPAPQLGPLRELRGQLLHLLRPDVVVAQAAAQELVDLGGSVAHRHSVMSSNLSGFRWTTACTAASPISVSARAGGSALMTGMSVPNTICSTPNVAIAHSSASRPHDAVSTNRLGSIRPASPLNARHRSSRNGPAPPMIAKHTR